MNPFGQLVAMAESMASNAARLPTADAAQQALGLPPGTTKLNALIHLLDVNGPMATVDLARAMQLDTNRVRGLLKNPRERGQVIYGDGLWELDRDWVGRENIDVLDQLSGAIDQALAEARPVDVLSILTGAFVGLTVELVRRQGHDTSKAIKVDGGLARDITIHALKG
jgi:hypothetical protein